MQRQNASWIRVKRIREILKQDQYAPLPVWYQVIIIYAATKQYLLDIAVEDVLAFEKDCLTIWIVNIRRFRLPSAMTRRSKRKLRNS